MKFEFNCPSGFCKTAGSSLSSVTVMWSLSKVSKGAKIKTHLSQLSTGSIQEDPSLFN